MSGALILIRWLHFTTVLVLFGSVLFQYYSGITNRYRDVNREVPDYSAWLHRLLVATCILVLLSAAAWLALVIAEMGDGLSDVLRPEAIIAVLTGTTFGQVWLVHMAASVALVVAVVVRPPRGYRLDVVLVLGALLVTSQSWVGHAVMEHGLERVFHLASNVIHGIASAAWLGGLLPLSHILNQARTNCGNQSSVFVLGVVWRYSTMSLIAVILIILSGLVNSWFLVGNAAFLINTPYGRVLLLKLALFCAMMGVGAFNRFVVLPRLVSEDTRQPANAFLWRAIVFEQGLGLSVLAIVSILGTLPPAIIGH